MPFCGLKCNKMVNFAIGIAKCNAQDCKMRSGGGVRGQEVLKWSVKTISYKSVQFLHTTITKDNDTMKRRIEITYQWWGKNGEDVKAEHVDILKESALDRIFKMRQNGYVSGELSYRHTPGDDLGNAIEYRGWWKVEYWSPGR